MTLQPGEVQDITLRLDMRALACYADAGDGNLLLDASSADLRCAGWAETTTPLCVNMR